MTEQVLSEWLGRDLRQRLLYVVSRRLRMLIATMGSIEEWIGQLKCLQLNGGVKWRRNDRLKRYGGIRMASGYLQLPNLAYQPFSWAWGLWRRRLWLIPN